MKKIIVPTDFSENAMLAAKYAADLCLKQGYGLHIVHYYTASSSRFAADEIDGNVESQELLKADLTIVEWIDSLKQDYPTLQISHKNSRGLIHEKLLQEAKKEEYIAIVIGSVGSSAKKNVFWGSNAVIISSKSVLPVIVIPQKQESNEVKNVGLLTNFKEEELLTLKEFASIFDSKINLNLLHVYKDADELRSVNGKLESWIHDIEQLPYVDQARILTAPIDKMDKNSDSTPEVIRQLVDSNNLDLILVSKSRKTFFQRLFSTSVSKAMALNLEKPAFFGKSI